MTSDEFDEILTNSAEKFVNNSSKNDDFICQFVICGDEPEFVSNLDCYPLEGEGRAADALASG